MQYLNTKTGAVIDSPFTIKGGNWVVKGKKENKRDDLEKKSKSELFIILEELEIDYKPTQTKKELIELLRGD